MSINGQRREKGKLKIKYLKMASGSMRWGLFFFCAFDFVRVRVAGVGRFKKMSLVEFQAGDVNGDSPSSTDEVSPY